MALVGERLSVGASGSGYEAMAKKFIKAYWLEIGKNFEARYLGVAETAN